jgi:hypothetical protein
MFGVGVVTVALAAGCGGGTHHVAASDKTHAAKTRHCVAGTRPVGSSRVAWGATARRATTAYRTPAGAPIRRFGLLNVNGAATVFGVLGRKVDAACHSPWLHVALPIRPNGVTGWIRARDVDLVPVRTRITVDLSQRQLLLYRNDKLVLRTTVAVGSSATPTPLGRYYVNQRLISPSPGGPYGPGAVGISAFSPVLTGWAQGGPIGIHGTNEPWSIGHAVSNGCVRLRNPVLRRVFRQAVAGTPVLIQR